MATTLLGMIGASSRTSARGSWRPVSRKVPIGCPSISAIVASAPSPSTTPNAGSPPAENLAMRTGRRPSIRRPSIRPGGTPRLSPTEPSPFPAVQGHSRPVRVVATGLARAVPRSEPSPLFRRVPGESLSAEPYAAAHDRHGVPGPRDWPARFPTVALAVAGQVGAGHSALSRAGPALDPLRGDLRDRLLRDPVHRAVPAVAVRLQRGSAALALAGQLLRLRRMGH